MSFNNASVLQPSLGKNATTEKRQLNGLLKSLWRKYEVFGMKISLGTLHYRAHDKMCFEKVFLI